MKKIIIIAIAFIIAIVAGIIFISAYEEDTEITKDATPVGLILVGPKDDKSWNQSHYDNLSKTAEELNLSINCRESVSGDEVMGVIEELIGGGCEIIVADTFEYCDAMVEAAKKYPGIYFFHATGISYGKNLSTYFGRIYQIRYLTGIVAGLQTETDEIGYVAAMPISEVNRGINAFTLGVKSVNPDATVYVEWTDAWTDDEAAKNATNALLEKHNIDVITMHVDSIAPLGIAEEKGIFSIGYNRDNSEYYPSSFLTAAVWNWEEFYTPNLLKCLQGKFEGKHHWVGAETGIIALAPLTENVKDGTAEAVQEKLDMILSGTFDVFYGPVYDNEGNLRISEGENITDNVMLNEFDWYVEGVVTE